MRTKFFILSLVFLFVSCNTTTVETRHHPDYVIGNPKETACVETFIKGLKSRTGVDTLSIDSYATQFPAIFAAQDYNAVYYERKYVDSSLLDHDAGRFIFEFFYLIDQDKCLNRSDYWTYIHDYEHYTEIYRVK